MSGLASGCTYLIRNTLYLALTNRANARTLIATRGPGFAMPASSGFTPLSTEPGHEEVIEEVMRKRSEGTAFEELCFAGVGEPLLRLSCLEQCATELRPLGLPIRVNTNGLLAGSSIADTVYRLKGAGLSGVSVALATADPKQYDELMEPESLRYSPVFSLQIGHAEVCEFVTACVGAELSVECTAVAAPGVDVEATKALATSLGATFRSRPWFA
jgi:TatD family-associated radical SAM protein